MRCQDIHDQLVVYAEGRLEPAAREAFRRHLQTCSGCRAALARVDGLALLVATLADVPPPAGMADRVIAAAWARTRLEPARRQPFGSTDDWNPLHWWHEATRTLRWSTAALAVAGLVLGTVVGRQALQPSAGTVGTSADPLAAYAVDYLADTPDGSLAGSYLALLETDGEVR